jgi:DNA-directed RNA polymerase subunit RPC12/RpoP
LPWEATVRVELDQNQKRKILEMAQGRGIVTECEACGSKRFAVGDTADPVGEGASGAYTAKVVCEECGTTARLFEVRESEF